MDFKGTKNKWKRVKLEKTIYSVERNEIQYGNDGECVAEFVSNDYDAQLISKASEMLEMLEECLLVLNNTLSYLKNIEQYIPIYDKLKFKTNLKLIESKVSSTKQLITQATEL